MREGFDVRRHHAGGPSGFQPPGQRRARPLPMACPVSDAPEGDDLAPRPRRRRGSRGGRNRRKKPAAVTTGSEESGLDASDEYVPHDYTDAAADRGLTTDDVADVAREEAGLPAPPLVPPAAAEDRRYPPGPGCGHRRERRHRRSGEETPPSARGPRTRSRDGRNRRRNHRRERGCPRGHRSRGAGRRRHPRRSRDGGRARARSRRRRPRAPPRPHPQGAPVGPLPHVRARARRWAHPHRGPRGPEPRRAHPRDADGQRVDRRQHLPRPRPERAPRHGSRVRRHRHAEERRAVPRRRRVRRQRRGGWWQAEDRADAQERTVGRRAGHEEPDRAQGRAPHAGGEPRRSLPRDGAG